MESVKKLNSNRLQHLIMFVLILILALIIGVYVYYGIQVAERSNQEQQVNIVEATPTSPDAERQKIIEDLAKPSPNNLTEEEKIYKMAQIHKNKKTKKNFLSKIKNSTCNFSIFKNLRQEYDKSTFSIIINLQTQ